MVPPFFSWIAMLRLEFLVKRRKIVPECRFAATDAGMARLNRPAGAVIEFGHRAVVIGLRTSATDFIEAIAQSRLLRTEFFHEFLIFKV